MERSLTVWIDVSWYQVQVWNGIVRVRWNLRSFAVLCTWEDALFWCVRSLLLPKSISLSFLRFGTHSSSEVGRRKAENNCWTPLLSCSSSAAELHCMKRCSPAAGSDSVLIQIRMGPRFCKLKAFWDNLSPTPSLQLLCWDVVLKSPKHCLFAYH